MDERQLNDLLNSEKIPPADENARKRAMNLALAAFDETQREKQKKRQGFRLLDRLTGRSKTSKGRRSMTRGYVFGGMATAMVAVLAVFTYTTLQPGLINQMTALQPEAKEPAAPGVALNDLDKRAPGRPDAAGRSRRASRAPPAPAGSSARSSTRPAAAPPPRAAPRRRSPLRTPRPAARREGSSPWRSSAPGTPPSAPPSATPRARRSLTRPLCRLPLLTPGSTPRGCLLRRRRYRRRRASRARRARRAFEGST